jgi:hypothetical protein
MARAGDSDRRAKRRRSTLLGFVSAVSFGVVRPSSIIPAREQSVRERRATLSGPLLVGLILYLPCFSQMSNVRAQSLNEGVREVGVRHSLVASIEPDRDSVSTGQEGQANKATADVSVRVLDYAHDYRFYGVVHGKFSDFNPHVGAAAQEIWADPACHQNRGLPTITVLAIDGQITQDGKSSEFAARPRYIGGRLPVDEIVLKRDNPAAHGNPNQSFVMLASTSQSHVIVKLILKTANCSVNHQ